MDATIFWESFSQWAANNAYSTATGLIALIVGWYFARIASKQVRRLVERSRTIDNNIGPVLSQLVRYSILIVTAVIVLSQFGVATTSILAVLGAAGLAIALALQGTLSNIAAGVMLIWLRPFSNGEYIESNSIAGTIDEIGLFATKLHTPDGVYLFVPNSELWNTSITNFDRLKTRRVDVNVGIAYGASIAEARKVLLRIATRDGRVLADPTPAVFVDALGDSAVNLVARCWVPTNDYWDTIRDLTEEAKLALDKAGIEIPYNTLDVNLISSAQEKK
ncbi:MAG TPA: mechanosensitive ion channel [Devosia sp.]|nr:mechanosensitive ion channel [Devosia sp.]